VGTVLSDVRHTKIIEWLNLHGSAKVSDLSKELQVTEKTIRDDLEKLESKGLLRRVHGGAMLIEDADSMLPIARRRGRQHPEKQQIAAEASKLIRDGQIVLLDAGSTTLELAKLIVQRRLTVITNDTKIAGELAESNDIELCVLGGYRRKGTYTLIGPSALETMKELNVDIAFLGCTGIDLQRGVSIFHQEEAELKKQIIKSSKTNVLLADHTKFERTALITYASISDLDAVITDEQTGTASVQGLTEAGVQVIRAKG
jgi:DeoR family fructose operon transcriptional repressor